MKTDYTKFQDKQLDDLLEDLKFQLIRTSHSSLAVGKKRKSSAKKIRKEIARLLTEIRRRELKDKEEKSI